jgi:ADP-ribosylglycohydrolase
MNETTKMNRLGTKDPSTLVTAGLIGLAVGDALGVPVEFASREDLDLDPVIGMRAHGTHRQPAGTWSDDTSLALCLTESLCTSGIDLQDQARRFVDWLFRSTWTPHGVVFDVGNATGEAIGRLKAGVAPIAAGSTRTSSCGNGSLMRILPLALYLAYAEPQFRIESAMVCSRLTHGHVRCQLACALFVEVSAEVIRGAALTDAIAIAQQRIGTLVHQQAATDLEEFLRLLGPGLKQLERPEISGSGYVIHCLEASLWCALHSSNYAAGVLAAVNLGEDTDTTGAVAGGLLGLLYGLESIPAEWIETLARKDELFALAERFQKACLARWEADQ